MIVFLPCSLPIYGTAEIGSVVYKAASYDNTINCATMYNVK